ncbi:ATP-dependent DNA helicase PIF1-like [Paramuricea clavata]|uniref:ATP-dependent DNA helicase PIF1-like n=1 Tax=Paramuricea clavata TaxID=317549 RepID=A0A6S7IF74_PARCT|nr:ATP-dependent DNA helicase PIF1-like [Paramuricea clavata]
MPYGVKVLFDDPRVGKLFKDSTTQAILIKPVTVDFFGKEGIQIQRTQIPLMPSWAVTIHKSQGMTVSNVVINLGPKCNKPGQAYVALSRVQSLRGLALTEFTEKSIKVSRKMSFQTVSDLKNLPSSDEKAIITKPIKVKVIVDPVYHHDDNPTTPNVIVMSIVADDSGTIKCHISNEKDIVKKFFQKNASIVISKCTITTCDEEPQLNINMQSSIFLIPTFNLKQNLPLPLLPSFPTIKLTPIAEALKLPRKRQISIEGKITKIEPPIKVKNNSIDLKKVFLKDTTGMMQVSLWKDKASLPLSQGDVISFTGLQTSMFQNRPMASSTTHTQVKVSENQDLILIDTDDEYDQLYKDGTIIGIQNVICYNSCSNKQCRNKKLDSTNQCPRCSKIYPDDKLQKAYVSNLCLQTEEDLKSVTVFQKVFIQLFTIDENENRQAEDLTAALLQKLPISLKYKENDDIIQEIILL